MKSRLKSLLLALLLVPAPAAFAKENACQLSTQATLNSCQSAAQSSYSATVVGCDNDSKSGAAQGLLAASQIYPQESS
jgi:hypothetical protein